jgi:predicted nuclease of restriction endonuclease-like RecB superfamily
MQLEKMNKELAELESRESRLMLFLENGTYSEDTFLKRNKLLQAEMEDLKSRIFECKKTMPKDIDYEQQIVKLKKAIAGLRDPNMSVEDQNKLLKAIVDRIDYEFIERLGKGKANYKLHIKLLV